MTPEQVQQRNWAAQILAPTARDVASPVDRRTDGPPPPPGPHAERPIEPPPLIEDPVAEDPVAEDSVEVPAEEPPVADEAFWAGGAVERAGIVAPPLADTTEVHRRIMSVARATERCARVLSGLAVRVDALDERLASRPVAPPPRPERAEPAPELTLMSDQIGRLAAEVAQTHARVTERFTAMDALQSEIGALASEVGAMHERLEEVARAQRVQHVGMSSSPVVQAMQRSLGELRGELATVGSRLVGVDARLDELRSLPARMEEVAAGQFQQLVSEVLSVPDDLEGVYRELERIAERMAAREDAVGGMLERLAATEEAVTGLRLDLDRVIGGLAAAREAQTEAREWRLAMERRLAALEAPGSEIERLYLALDRMVGEQAARQPGCHDGGEGERPNRTDTSGGGPLAADHDDDGPPGKAILSALAGGSHSEQAVEALTAELERIRRSIEVLVRPGARPSSGRRAAR